MSVSPPPMYDAHSITTATYSTSSLKPYLELPHLLSLTWLAYPILSLLFVAFRMIASSADTQDSVDSAKKALYASCKAAERAATSTASMPRFMAQATNEQFADAVNATINASRVTLTTALTIMEAIINFIIDIYRSTFLCFLELVVRGGISIMIGAVNELNNVIQSAAQGIQSAIQDSVSASNDAIKAAVDGINKINPFDDISAPQISTPDLSALNNVTLPSSFTQALTDMNNTIPSVDQLKQDIEKIIDTPFELVKKDINDTFAGISGYNSSVMPVPQLNTVTFCNDLDTSVIDDLGRDLIKLSKIGIVVLIVLALILVALNCLLTWYKWRCMHRHFDSTREAWSTDPTLYQTDFRGTPTVSLSNHNLLLLEAASAHPILTIITNRMARIFRLSPQGATHLSWFFNYVFHAPALACLLIGLLGVLSVQIQLFALGPIADHYRAQSASTASDFSNKIATSINDSMYNQSAAYARDVNVRIDEMQNTINNGIFGWVNGTTTTLNDTINTFYDDIQNGVGTVFNGTILEQPAHEFIRCLIGTKVDAIENALTFLHDNLIINMPRMNDSALVLSPESVNEASTPIAAAAIGSDQDGDGGVLGRLITSYADSLKKERIMFLIFIALWGFVVLMALCVILWHTRGKKFVEMRKRRRWEREQRGGIDGLVVPFREGQPAADFKAADGYNSNPRVDLPSFSPLPSPRQGSFGSLFTRNRSASPAPPSEKQQQQQQSSLPPVDKESKTWASFFTRKQPSLPTISKPMRLMAVGRKTDGDLVLKGEGDMVHNQDVSERRDTAWFGRFANKLGAAKQDNNDRNQRNLRISVDRPLPEEQQPRSRWSHSPETAVARHSLPWLRVTSPTTVASSNRSGGPTPPKRELARQNSIVPSDVNSVYEESAVPTPFAPPLHHGFESHHRSRTGSEFSASKDSAIFIPPPPIHPSMQNNRLKPLLTANHRKSASMPGSPRLFLAPGQGSTPSLGTLPSSVNSSNFALSSIGLGSGLPKKPAENPFVTPFDDEHRVEITQASRAPRRSIPINPFGSPVAM